MSRFAIAWAAALLPLPWVSPLPAQQAAGERESFVRIDPSIEATEFVDTLGDFRATYSVTRFDRGRVWKHTDRERNVDSGVRDVLASGKLTVARRGEWIVFTYELTESNPDAVGGVNPVLDRYFIHDNRLVGYQHDGFYSESPSPQWIGLAQPPFSTDLGYVWKGDAFVPPGEVDAHARSRGLLPEPAVMESGLKVSRSRKTLPQAAAGAPTVTVLEVTRRKPTGELVSRGENRIFEFPDGSQRVLADKTLEVTRHLDGFAAGFNVRLADLTKQVAMPLPSTPADLDAWTRDHADLFLPKFAETYELLSLEPLVSGDKVSPADFSDEIQTVGESDWAEGEPLHQPDGAATRRFDPALMKWVPIGD